MKKHIPVLVLICGVMLAGGISSTALAEFNLEKLKGLAEQAKAYQEKLKQGSPSNASAQTDPSTQASRDTALTSETSGGNITTQMGHDILGIRLGMSPADARHILEKHPNLIVREVRGALVYQPASGHPRQIQNSGYVKLFSAIPKGGFGSRESITINFTPTAGRERAISIEREQTFLVGEEPSADAATKALLDKYGPLSYKRNPGGPFTNYFWRFDAQGNLRDVKRDVVVDYGDVCGNPARAALETMPTINSPQDAQQLQGLLAKFEKCGHTQIFAQLDVGGARADARIVRSLKVILSGWAEAVAARRSIDIFIENNGKDQAGKDIHKADKRKLDL